MSVVTYTAKTSLLPGHTADTSYELDLRMISATPTKSVRRSDQQALSGKREILEWNQRSGLQLTVGSYEENSIMHDAVVEFLDSVVTGASFVFDRWGRVGVPSLPRSAVVLGDYQESRYLEKAGEGNDLMRFTFEIEFI